MDSQRAIEALERAYADKAASGSNATVRVGYFGNGLPLELIESETCLAIDVKMAPELELEVHVEEIAPYIEPFVDDYARLFLHRFFSGAFNDLAAVIFCRDDAAGLVAYQYALEICRQNIVARSVPKLIVWNLVHRDTPAAVRFNRRETGRLWTELATLGIVSPDHDAIVRAHKSVMRRRAALSSLDTLRKCGEPRITSGEAFRWRNAGRFLSSIGHADLLDAAMTDARLRVSHAAPRRLGLIGSALDAVSVYDMLEDFGTVVSDLQPFGEVWPGPGAGISPEDILRGEAADPLCPRAEPAALHRDAIVRRCVEDKCDAVVAQLDQNDDSIGWDLPSLRSGLQKEGIPLVELGFRDHRPDAAWLAEARAHLAAALGEP